VRLRLADRDADRERVAEVDLRQLGRGRPDDREVPGLERALEATVWRSLTCDERMFAWMPSAAGAEVSTTDRDVDRLLSALSIAVRA
jgi:hypothetical protein